MSVKGIAKTVSWAVVLALLAAIVLYAVNAFTGSTGSGCETDLCCEGCSSVVVSGVIDGDTFDSALGRVRLYGVDAPERGQRCYREATERLRELAGRGVRLEPGPRSRDPSGRLLAYAYTRSGESIEETLIREGLARAWTRDGQHRDFLVGLEEEARLGGSGCLW